MKKQIVTIGLIVVLVLTSTVAQARRFRPRRFGVPCCQSQVQTQTKPELNQEDVTTETTPVQEEVTNESTQVQETIIDEGSIVDQGAVRAIIRVNEPTQTQEFEVKASVDHENHIYKEGEFMTVTVESTRPGYLYLFYKDAGGNVTVLFPNKFHQDNQIAANTPMLIPNDTMAFQLQARPPFGTEVLQAVVMLKPIDVKPIINFQNNEAFHQLNSRDLNVMEQKFNQKEDAENKIAERLIGITTIPNYQTFLPQTEEPSLKKNDEAGKAETIDEVPPAPGDEETVQTQELKEEPVQKQD